MTSNDYILNYYVEEGIVNEIIGLVNVGKEAEVYLGKLEDKLVAIKIFKDRDNRSFKQRSDYQNEGLYLKGREKRALRKKSNFGILLDEEIWYSREVDNLEFLKEAGASVPDVYCIGDRSFAMEFIGDELSYGMRLSDIKNDINDPVGIYNQVVKNMKIFKRNSIVHGDLSAYNILVHKGKVVIIDFPQSLFKEQNRNYMKLFKRDCMNITKFFKRLGVKCDCERDIGLDVLVQMRSDFLIKILG